MMITLKYDIPKKVSMNSIYSGIHWRTRKKHADIYHNLVYKDCLSLEKITEKVDLTFEFHFRTITLDSSNCAYMGKMIEDGLVKNGLFQDDSHKYIGKVTYEAIRIPNKERKNIEKDFIRLTITKHGSK